MVGSLDKVEISKIGGLGKKEKWVDILGVSFEIISEGQSGTKIIVNFPV